MTTDRPTLRTLAGRLNVLPEYVDYTGTAVQRASDSVMEAIVGLMGYNGSDERAAADSIRRLDDEERSAILKPAAVVQKTDAREVGVTVCTPSELHGRIDWRLELITEEGAEHASEGTFDAGEPSGRIILPLPANVGLGYHKVRLTLRDSRREANALQRFIVTPERCTPIDDVLGGRRSFGLCVNLYTIRSRRNWGIGDFGDLEELCRWAGRNGGAFVALNPLHALRNVGWDISAYTPISRLYKNAIYLDPTAVPELARCRKAREEVESLEKEGRLRALRDANYIDYEQTWTLKLRVLRMLHRTFLAEPSDDSAQRHRDFLSYVETSGHSLRRFATFMALETHLADQGFPRDWRQWPAEFRDPEGAAVQHFADTHAEEIGFWEYVQFELDRQLRQVTSEAAEAGMAIGLYQDLALGSSVSGVDAWSNQDLFVEGASVGSPPDDYSSTGQEWGFPPVNPHRLEQQRFDYWIQLVRGAFAHSGALRIDHVMGLYRQFWIPQGRGEGAYVAYPSDALMGILALESRRHGAIVIGEDLGTVPPGFSDVLARRNILSCRVLYFEREPDGAFRRSNQYSDRALVTNTTHDHPPLACFWQGRDLELRRSVNHIPDDDALQEAWNERRQARVKLIELLAEEGLLPDAGADPADVSVESLCIALHEFLFRTPAPLAGIMLDDLSQETEPVNIPGVGMDRYPVWSRKMRRTLKELQHDLIIQGILASAQESRGTHARKTHGEVARKEER